MSRRNPVKCWNEQPIVARMIFGAFIVIACALGLWALLAMAGD